MGILTAICYFLRAVEKKNYLCIMLGLRDGEVAELAPPRRGEVESTLHMYPVVYILKSEISGKYYIGSTGDLDRRLRDHNSGNGGVYTGLHMPWKLVCYRSCKDISEAREVEKTIKKYKGGSAFKKILNGEVAEWSKAPHC